MNQVFEIFDKLPGLNDYINACKSHRNEGSRMKREAQDLIGWYIKIQKVHPIKGRVKLHITWYEPNKKRDLDNVMFAKKFILDALQELGIIPNDNWSYIAGFEEEVLLDRNNPHIRVVLEEIDDSNE